MDRALGLSHPAADRDLATYILVSKAELANDMRVAVEAEQALRMAPPHSRLAVLAATRAARGYALNGDRTATERTYDYARQLLSTIDDDPDSPCPSWLNETTIALSQAQSWTVLGDYHRAVESFQDGITELPSSYRRGRGVYVARAALALAGDRQVVQAATWGREALAIGTDTRSGRILTEPARPDDALAHWNTVPAVVDFRTAMRHVIVHQA